MDSVRWSVKVRVKSAEYDSGTGLRPAIVELQEAVFRGRKGRRLVRRHEAGHPRADLYVGRLRDRQILISFMAEAELEQWGSSRLQRPLPIR